MTYGKMIRLSLFIALLVTAVAIFILSGNHQWVEKSYSNTLFPGLASFLRFLLGSLPFSVGDFLYMVAGMYVLWELFLFFKILLKRKAGWKERFVPFQKAGLVLLFIYVYFYLFWGLNYYRLGIEHQLGLKNGSFVKEELIALNKELLQKVNETKIICLERKDTVIARQRMFSEAVQAYQNLEKLFPFIRYKNASLKSSFFGRAGNYIGFQGYYNPFTGEAQVNTRIPNFLQPYVTCHEMAHQIGYASESEANFVGFLAATHSADTLMQYSSYFDMFLYALGNLSAVDSTAAKAIARELHEGVKRDLRTYREFSKKHRTFIQGWTDVLYDYYLRRNRQRKGIESYNEVTGWLIAYKKKNGSL
jgi:hypothetical protein